MEWTPSRLQVARSNSVALPKTFPAGPRHAQGSQPLTLRPALALLALLTSLVHATSQHMPRKPHPGSLPGDEAHRSQQVTAVRTLEKGSPVFRSGKTKTVALPATSLGVLILTAATCAERAPTPTQHYLLWFATVSCVADAARAVGLRPLSPGTARKQGRSSASAPRCRSPDATFGAGGPPRQGRTPPGTPGGVPEADLGSSRCAPPGSGLCLSARPLRPTLGSMAASYWMGPSILMSGRLALTSLTASVTFWTCVAMITRSEPEQLSYGELRGGAGWAGLGCSPSAPCWSEQTPATVACACQP